MTATVPVALPGREYDVVIGTDLLSGAGARIAALGGRKHVAILTDDTVAGLHLPQLQASLTAAGITSEALRLPAGEATKSWSSSRHAVISCSTRKLSAMIS